MVPPEGGSYFETVNPATGHHYADVPDSDERDVAKAVSACQAAFKSWSELAVSKRSFFLNKIADLIDRDLEKVSDRGKYRYRKTVESFLLT